MFNKIDDDWWMYQFVVYVYITYVDYYNYYSEVRLRVYSSVKLLPTVVK